MKTDIDNLMIEKELDAILVIGPAQHNPPMYYLTGGGHITKAILIKKPGIPAILYHQPMERDEATRTGLPTKNLTDFSYDKLLKAAGGDVLEATVNLYKQILLEAHVSSGRLAIYGQIDAGASYAIFNSINKAFPELTIIGELDDSLLLTAMATKDQFEVDRIREMGMITTEVVGQVADYLTSQKVKNEVLIKTNGEPLTIGDVKKLINLWLAERGAANPEGTIFAIGRDAGVPHSSGTTSDLIRLGKTIIFDIFPCEVGGGYYYDFTRTWSLGYATDEVLAIYEDVSSVYQQIMSELAINTPCKPYQARTCDLFESKGHPTNRIDPKSENGYVHSLGHGLGLHVHEKPWFGNNASDDDRLEPGVVVTIEPGLYYPDRGMGVRLEDTVWARPDGKMEILAEYPHDLLLPMQ